MNAVLACAGARLWRQRVTWLSLAVLVALGGGAVLAAVAGGRRTDSAYQRFAAAHRAADVFVFPAGGPTPTTLPADYAAMAKFPEVVAAAVLQGFNTDGPSVIAVSGGYGRTINDPKVLSGRLPRPDHAEETTVSLDFAQSQHVSVGSRLTVRFLAGAPGRRPGSILPITLRVVGVEISPGDFPPQLNGGALVQVAVTPAFVATYAGRLGPSLSALVLRFRHGDADVPAFEAGLRQLSSSNRNGSPYIDVRQAQQAANVQRGIHLEAVALWLLAGFAALTMTLVLFQLMSRQAMLAAADHDTLRALGMTRDELWLCGMATAAAIGVVGAAGAIGVAVAASPLLPVGTARLAETHPGIAFDPLALGLGALTVLVLVPALALWPCRRAAAGALDESRQRPLDRPPLLARTAGAASLPPTASVGIGMALQPGRGRTAVPVRSSLAGVTLAVAALAAAVTFGASLTHLLDTPRLYGWNWDAHISDLTNTSAAGIRSVMPALVADQRIEAVAILGSPPLIVGPTSVSSVTLDDIKGRISPVVVQGREPESADEVALGARTLDDAGTRLGGTVPISISVVRQLRVPKRVVGVVVLPPETDAARFGVGAILTSEGEHTLVPPEIRAPPSGEAVLRFAPGVDRTRLLADLHRLLGPQWAIDTPQPPSDLVNFGHVQNLPFILAGLLAALALATLAHTLMTSVHRRARDLAVLKSLGFVPAQVLRTVAWQATTLASVALVIGVPVGVAVGRVVWDTFANQLGTLPEPVTPPLPLALMFPIAILAANAVAAIPGYLAARTPPALVLRTE